MKEKQSQGFNKEGGKAQDNNATQYTDDGLWPPERNEGTGDHSEVQKKSKEERKGNQEKAKQQRKNSVFFKKLETKFDSETWFDVSK